MKFGAVLLAALVLAGCATSPEVTVLLGPKRVEDSSTVGATFMFIQRFGKHGACGYVHSSDPAAGPPFNGEHEFTLDTGGCGVRFGGKTK